MAKAFDKGIVRTIAQSRKRFVSILVICALGITMVCGLRAACVDLRQTADVFYDAQQLYDVKIQSTLGLTEDDVASLAEMDGVEVAEGAWEETTYTSVSDARGSVDVKALSCLGINSPQLLEGRLPTSAGEVAVTQDYLADAGMEIGDTVTLEDADEDSEVFERVGYTIVGVVIDPAQMTNPNGSIAIRAAASSDYFFFVDPASVTADAADAFTALYVRVEGAADDLCYSDAYTEKVDAVLEGIEALRADREEARTDEIKQDALEVIDEEEAKANQELADAQAQLDSGQEEINDGWQQLAQSRATLATSQEQLESGAAQLAEQEAELASGREQIQSGYAQIAEGQAQIDEQRGNLESSQTQVQAGLDQVQQGLDQVQAGYAQAQQEYAAALAQLEAALAAGQMTQEQYDVAVAQAQAAYDAGIATLDAQASELTATQSQLSQQAMQIEEGLATLSAEEANLAQSKQELDESNAELESGAAQLAQAQATLATSRTQLEQGRAEIASGEEELARSQATLDVNRAEFESEKADAAQEIADARAEVEDLESARWYVQDRTSNTAYASVQSDAGSIEAIGFVFPVVFIIVAVLIGLTTITRMVEEERGLIGTYKSLGYSNARILSKYFVYALSACVIGGVLGLILGFVAFPVFLFSVFKIMYLFSDYQLGFDALYGLGSFLLFVVGIAGAAVLACRSELKQTPASLMRPKAPRSGSRILLERVGFVWRRMSFLNKVTARNLFRYKKRFFMTVFGIMGCMALLICGFAIKDTVSSISERQYTDINRYDLLVTMDSDSLDEARQFVESFDGIESTQPASVDNVTLTAGGDSESLQLYVVPDGADLSLYVNLRASEDVPVQVGEGGMLLTRNAAELLGVADGSGSVWVKTSAMDTAEVPVDQVIDNYLGNAAYMSAGTYELLFGEAAKNNALYVNLDGSVADQAALADEMAQGDHILTVSSTQQMIDEFSQAFQLINTVVAVVIVLAAALAFVVLFTLSTTNISERVRELATIKVLGFRAREVNHYVNKETVLLTALGVLLGLPAGAAFSESLTYVLKMPSIYFDVTINPISYVYAAALTLFFALVVALLSNHALRRINMIEALKSVE